MKDIGQGVFELKARDASGAYRLIYLKKIKGVVHVLHCFQKKSQKTDQRDIDLARKRLKEVNAFLREQ